MRRTRHPPGTLFHESGGDGSESQPATRAIPIVAFTAYAMKGDELRMRSAGCEAYVSKPVDVTTLAARLRSHLPQTG